jgi:hypothetical protein
MVWSFPFPEPGADSAKKFASIHSNKPPRKRPYIPNRKDHACLLFFSLNSHSEFIMDNKHSMCTQPLVYACWNLKL